MVAWMVDSYVVVLKGSQRSALISSVGLQRCTRNIVHTIKVYTARLRTLSDLPKPRWPDHPWQRRSTLRLADC